MEEIQTFREWLKEQELYEAKQVGTIYHFTKPLNIFKLLSSEYQQQLGLEILEFMSYNGHFSTTRNSSLVSDFSHPTLSIKNGYNIRLAFDGDKISNNFKIKPVLGLRDDRFSVFDKNIIPDERVPKKWKEHEEIVLGKKSLEKFNKFKLKDYLIQIDIYNVDNADSEEIRDLILEMLEDSKLKIPVNIVRKFVNIKDTNRVKLDETFGKLKEDELELKTCTYLEIIKD